MKRRVKRIIVAALASFAALTAVGTAVAMPIADTSGTSSSLVVRPDDRGGARGFAIQSRSAQVSASLPVRGEHSFGGNTSVQPQAASSSSQTRWGRTVGISAAGLALALGLVAMTLVGLRRQRRLAHA